MARATSRSDIAMTLNESRHVLYHVDLITVPPYLSLPCPTPIITLDKIYTSRSRVVSFLYKLRISDLRNLNKGVSLLVDCRMTGALNDDQECLLY